ncbi:hypothetical protein QJU96_02830 [Pasteurella skyensis]|uniref:hypothetical protein n=1 Tax=Phocoenobacter skyensis TaxID=97481 RepID=UPI00278D2CED|nr:hypothetical protein [Pasteurella skyensis]MDP8170224.1 hypothetical protein [Pasteurella skyensis]
MNLKNNFSTDTAKKIFGNKDNAISFLLALQNEKKFDLPVKIISRGKNKGQTVLDLNTNELWTSIVKNWDFENGEKIIRNLFKESSKYKSGKNSYKVMQILLEEWQKLQLGNISWPFSQGDFDGFVQRVNSENIFGIEKDEKVKQAAVKYRRIKEINTVRNDFIETLIFEKNTNILPTLNHRRGVDFFINGISFDQKVAKSPTNEFKKRYGANWKKEAIKHPEKVAEYLYKYQDEGRFGADSRLLVVYLDEDISIDKIAETIQKTDLENPLEITFQYNHKTQGIKTYKVNCFIILLYN